MAKKTNRKILSNNLHEHPAVQAWAKLNPRHKVPERIEILRETHTNNPSIYRLLWIGDGGTSVVAKRCQTELANLDRIFYEEVLPHIPLPFAYYHGYLDEDDLASWLFLEDVGNIKYSPHVEEHRNLATEWMCIFHTSTELVPSEVVLPKRGLSYYYDHLQQGRETIQNNISNSALDIDDLILLRNIISLCDLLELKWNELMSICYGTPRTLTHGDFKKSNVYIRQTKGRSYLVVLDWETAGIGIPTIDVAEAKIDINKYWSCVREFWPRMDIFTIKDLAEIGKILRYIAAIDWEAQRLPYQWKSQSITKLNIYQTRITSALHSLKLIS